jgi:RHS repeat-associated protein
MNLLPQISKTASRQKIPSCAIAPRENRLERRTSARVWRRRSLKLVSAPCQDQETGTYYNYMRTYLPMVGRYGETDPIGLRGGINSFGYAQSSPGRRIDPKGLDVWVGGNAGGRIDVLLFGGGAKTGLTTNTSTGETCFVSYRCINVGFGILVSLGAEVNASLFGPKCGRDLNGLEVSLTLDLVAPGGPGISGSLDAGSGGLGVGVGPSGGAGAFIGLSFCAVRVLSCMNTPCDCFMDRCKCPR